MTGIVFLFMVTTVWSSAVSAVPQSSERLCHRNEDCEKVFNYTHGAQAFPFYAALHQSFTVKALREFWVSDGHQDQRCSIVTDLM